MNPHTPTYAESYDYDNIQTHEESLDLHHISSTNEKISLEFQRLLMKGMKQCKLYSDKLTDLTVVQIDEFYLNIIQSMNLEELNGGQFIEMNSAKNMYSVMEGEIMVVTSNPQNDDIYSDRKTTTTTTPLSHQHLNTKTLITKLLPGQTFGDVTQIPQLPRRGTIQALCKTILGKISIQFLEDTLRNQFQVQNIKIKLLSQFLKEIKSSTGLSALAKQLRDYKLVKGQSVYKEGDNSDCVFFIQEGQVILLQTTNIAGPIDDQEKMKRTKRQIENQEVEICKIELGMVFGQDEVLLNIQRQQTAKVCSANLHIYYLKKSFLFSFLHKFKELTTSNTSMNYTSYLRKCSEQKQQFYLNRMLKLQQNLIDKQNELRRKQLSQHNKNLQYQQSQLLVEAQQQQKQQQQQPQYQQQQQQQQSQSIQEKQTGKQLILSKQDHSISSIKVYSHRSTMSTGATQDSMQHSPTLSQQNYPILKIKSASSQHSKQNSITDLAMVCLRSQESEKKIKTIVAEGDSEVTISDIIQKIQHNKNFLNSSNNNKQIQNKGICEGLFDNDNDMILLKSRINQYQQDKHVLKSGLSTPDQKQKRKKSYLEYKQRMHKMNRQNKILQAIQTLSLNNNNNDKFSTSSQLYTSPTFTSNANFSISQIADCFSQQIENTQQQQSQQQQKQSILNNCFSSPNLISCIQKFKQQTFATQKIPNASLSTQKTFNLSKSTYKEKSNCFNLETEPDQDQINYSTANKYQDTNKIRTIKSAYISKSSEQQIALSQQDTAEREIKTSEFNLQTDRSQGYINQKSTLNLSPSSSPSRDKSPLNYFTPYSESMFKLFKCKTHSYHKQCSSRPSISSCRYQTERDGNGITNQSEQENQNKAQNKIENDNLFINISENLANFDYSNNNNNNNNNNSHSNININSPSNIQPLLSPTYLRNLALNQRKQQTHSLHNNHSLSPKKQIIRQVPGQAILFAFPIPIPLTFEDETPSLMKPQKCINIHIPLKQDKKSPQYALKSSRSLRVKNSLHYAHMPFTPQFWQKEQKKNQK